MPEIFIPMTPTPKQRPNFRVYKQPTVNKAGDAVIGHAYTPKKTKDAEAYIKAKLRESGAQIVLNAPISLSIHFLMPIAARGMPKGVTAVNGVFPVLKRPDIDNLAKLVMDACNGILWGDDAAVWNVRFVKYYSDKPGIRLYWRVDGPEQDTGEDEPCEKQGSQSQLTVA